MVSNRRKREVIYSSTTKLQGGFLLSEEGKKKRGKGSGPLRRVMGGRKDRCFVWDKREKSMHDYMGRIGGKKRKRMCSLVEERGSHHFGEGKGRRVVFWRRGEGKKLIPCSIDVHFSGGRGKE